MCFASVKNLLFLCFMGSLGSQFFFNVAVFPRVWNNHLRTNLSQKMIFYLKILHFRGAEVVQKWCRSGVVGCKSGATLAWAGCARLSGTSMLLDRFPPLAIGCWSFQAQATMEENCKDWEQMLQTSCSCTVIMHIMHSYHVNVVD